MNNLEMGYSTSTTKVYWCHICKKEFNKIFIENTDIQCRFCSNNFCEEITPDNLSDHPSSFQPFERIPGNNNRNNNNLLNLVYIPRGVRPRTSSSFLDMIINMLGQHEESNMESIINFIMQNDPNRYGNPPASKKVVENLDKITVNEQNIKTLRKDSGISDDNSCAICKDNFEINQNLIYLPCKHLFHDECILPWLKERNSCPTCRHELPTDDNEYEIRKNSI